jgi:hypothetical protein
MAKSGGRILDWEVVCGWAGFLHIITHNLSIELAASTSSGRAGAVGILQAILQAMLQGAGPVDYYLKVLKGIHYICWVLCSLLGGRLVPSSSVLVPGRFAPRSWRFVPGSSFRSWHCGFVGVAGSWRCWLLGIAASWALLAPRYCGFVGVAGS